MISSIQLPKNLQTQVKAKAKSLSEGQLNQLPDAFRVLDEVAAYRPGSVTSRLAQVAQKVGRDGDSTVAQMGGVEILEQLSNLGNSLGPALSMLVGPVGSVVRVALEGLDEVEPEDDFITTLAKTGLKAMDYEENSSNPMAGGLVAEPFILGIAEHDSVNETAAEVCNFLQEELPAMLAQPARQAYRSVLSDLSEEPHSGKSGLLARSGYALLHSIPGEEKALVAMTSSFLDELSQVENPFSAAVAEEATEFVEKYRDNDDTVPQALALTDAVLKALDMKEEPTDLQSAAQLGIEWTKALSGLDLPIGDRMEMANSYFENLTEEADTPVLELSSYWLERLPEEANEARLAIIEAVLADTVDSPKRTVPGIVEVAKSVAKGQPKVRDAALGALLGVMGEEMGQDELEELECEPYSAAGLLRKENALERISKGLEELSATG